MKRKNSATEVIKLTGPNGSTLFVRKDKLFAAEEIMSNGRLKVYLHTGSVCVVMETLDEAHLGKEGIEFHTILPNNTDQALFRLYEPVLVQAVEQVMDQRALDAGLRSVLLFPGNFLVAVVEPAEQVLQALGWTGEC